jgi:anti-sigma-K factor RskA
MNKDIKQLLESSLLEEYVLGVIDPLEIPEVESYILSSPEVKKVYEELQENIEFLAKKLSSTPPMGTKQNILDQIDASSKTPQPITRPTNWLAIAAFIAAFICAMWAMRSDRQKSELQKSYLGLDEQYVNLQAQCVKKEALYAQAQEQWMLLADPNMKKFLIKGNDRASALTTVAYLNDEQESSYLRILSLPALNEDKCLQLWADVDGEMISLIVLPKTSDQILTIPYMKDAESLNITIEPDGGSSHPTVANLVASVSI